MVLYPHIVKWDKLHKDSICISIIVAYKKPAGLWSRLRKTLFRLDIDEYYSVISDTWLSAKYAK